MRFLGFAMTVLLPLQINTFSMMGRNKAQSFHVIIWPGNSPDLNPIENCWNYMKDKLKNKDIGSLDKLVFEIKSPWTTDITQSYFKKLADSMQTRLKLVIKRKGEMTKY